MIGFHFNRSVSTNLKLNGPTLFYSTQPVDASENSVGVATFVGIITSSYPPESGDIVEGTYDFHWYFDNSEIFDISVDNNSGAYIESGGNITTCTFTNVSYLDNGKTVHIVADYIPATGEGNAINDNLKSTDAILTSFPEIVINTQPSNLVVGAGINGTYSIDAQIVPDNGESLRYQWTLDNVDLIDGTQNADGTTQSGNGTFNVTSDAGDNFVIDYRDISLYNSFTTGRTYTLISNSEFTSRISAIGGNGGDFYAATGTKYPGSVGGSAKGVFTFKQGQVYLLRVGGNGGSISQKWTTDFPFVGNPYGGFPGGGNGRFGSGGGGYTGLFVGSISQENAIMIAGGGGGHGNDGSDTGGDGGGVDGEDASNAFINHGGYGGTQSAGGQAAPSAGGGSTGTAGSALQGGSGGSAAGGGGYFGGGAGKTFRNLTSENLSPHWSDGGGGGGSGRLHPTLISEGEFLSTDYVTSNGGSFQIERITSIQRSTVTTSGVNTPDLIINASDSDIGGVIRCRLEATTQNSPLLSNSASFESVDPRNIIKFESYTIENLYKEQSIDFNNTQTFTLDESVFGSDYSIIQFHCTEKDIPLSLEMYGSKGSNNGSYNGGNGGVSTIQFTANRDIEYTLIGISNNSSLFLYRGSNLIAVIGEGGDAGNAGDGGDGGGINIPGSDGGGRQGGVGGTKINTGTLSLSGTYGSIYENSGIDLYPGDSVANSPSGGRTISCTKGSYWIDQGIAPCSDNSSSDIKFVNVDGTTITGSSLIKRGFKPGYTISNTSGLEINNGGRGGNGATGGGGGTSGSGGGGGSGYSDGSVTVTSSVLGGNPGNTKVIFRVV